MFTIQQPGDVCELDLQMQGVNKNELKEVLDIFVTYDPMNLGTPVNYRIEGNDKQMKVKFTPKYGAHVKLNFKPGKLDKPFSLKEISVLVAEKVLTDSKGKVTDRRYMDASLPVEERVESLLAVMTPEDKMELIREGWGIPGIRTWFLVWKRSDYFPAGFSNGSHLEPEADGRSGDGNRR